LKTLSVVCGCFRGELKLAARLSIAPVEAEVWQRLFDEFSAYSTLFMAEMVSPKRRKEHELLFRFPVTDN